MKFREAVVLGILLGCSLLAPPLAAQATPNCPRAGGQVTLGFQFFDFMNDRNYLQQYSSFPASAFRGNLTDVDFYSCPDAERDLKIEFQRRNPFRLVETNALSLSSEDFAFRVELWRYRNRPLEVFPSPTLVGTSFSSVFNSDVPPQTFFRTDRTRFDVKGHIRGAAFGDRSHIQGIWARYSNEQRNGRDQFRFMLGGSDRVSGFDTVRWRQESLEISSDVDEVEAGVLLGRAHRYALAFTLLVDRYTNEAPLTTNTTIAPFGGVTPTGATRIQTGGNVGLRTIDFLPDSRALQPTVQFLKGWNEDKYQLFAAYAFGRVDQKQLTPLEEVFAGGYRGRVQTHVVAVSPIIRLSETLDLRALFRDEIRDNESSFGVGQFLDPAANLTAPRLNRLSRLRYGVELNYRPKATKASATVGVSQRHTDRDLTFGVSPSEFIGPKVTLLRQDTDITTVQIRGKMEPIRNLALRAEYRFQGAQNTGLPVEPDEAHYVDVDANYDFSHASLNGGLSFHFQENRQSNDTHFFTGLIGTTEQASVRQDFVNNSRYYDVTLFVSPGETPLTFVASINRIEDRSAQNFIHSNRRRWETAAGVLFTLPERTPYANTANTGTVGLQYQFNSSWGVRGNYVITQSSGSFTGTGSLSSVIHPFSRFANRIQATLAGLEYTTARQFTISFEYSHENYDDRAQPALSGNLNTFYFAARKTF